MVTRPDPAELRLLARLLGSPDEAAGAEIREWAAEAPWLQDAAAELAATRLGDWQAEHMVLFVTGYPRTACPPFESAYRHGMMHGPAVEELLGFYAYLGLAPDDDAPADYLGTMLDCAALLMEHDSPALAELWDRHLALWVPRFAADLAAHAKLRLYRDVAARLAAMFPPPPAPADG